MASSAGADGAPSYSLTSMTMEPRQRPGSPEANPRTERISGKQGPEIFYSGK